MDAPICMEALEEALVKYGQPEISNSDQGSQFTGEVFTVFVERLWRSRQYRASPALAWLTESWAWR